MIFDESCLFCVALICDSETGTWYKFNDESVEKIDAKKLKFAIEDDCDGKFSTLFLFVVILSCI